MKMNKKGFTLIELLAVIVILAIIALIATPIVIKTIEEAQKGADARSVEAYGKELESLYYQELVKDPNATVDIDALTPELSGSGETVNCTSESITNGLVTLDGCSVGGRTQKYSYTSKEGAKPKTA